MWLSKIIFEPNYIRTNAFDLLYILNKASHVKEASHKHQVHTLSIQTCEITSSTSADSHCMQVIRKWTDTANFQLTIIVSGSTIVSGSDIVVPGSELKLTKQN